MAGVGSATAAAARGGTTTVLSFTGPATAERDLDALLRNRAELDRDGAAVDVGLHAAIYDPEHLSHDDLAAIKHQNTIEAAHRRRTERDHDRGASADQPLRRLLNQRPRFGIQAGAGRLQSKKI